VPAAEADCPVLRADPGESGVLPYSEGLLIGYRGYDANCAAPRYPFGHGLGYTTWDYESIDCPAAGPGGHDLELAVTMRNAGSRSGKEVVQVYLAGPHGRDERGQPVRVLAAFATVRAAPGESVRATLTIPARAFARYDEDLATWTWPGGQFIVAAGRSSRDLPLSASLQYGSVAQPGSSAAAPAILAARDPASRRYPA
jgi:beta-glucosidase